jgi:2-keto-4-pentenoate hydratase/2-oxohepta-3-ene-1,7-dioic acid hydratase in catechol pathway
MRIARTSLASHAWVASDDGDSWRSLAAIVGPDAGTDDVIAATERIGVALAGGELSPVSISSADLVAPVVRPSKILCIGLNYSEHVAEAGEETPVAPIVFAKFPSALTSPHGDIELDPALTEKCDYEVELAVVIGRRARRVSEAEALDHVYGYLVANDVSARDHQFADGQWDRSKSFDTFCPVGPWITTADEVPDPQALRLTTTVNGEVRQDASSGQMIHRIAYLIHYLSRGMTLEPGDVILTGTPSGVGLALDPPSFLRADDVVECRIEGLGAIRNRVTNPADAAVPAAV